ncbi:MAG TPA: phosphatase PAP2 family protein [Chitinophagaceae bacterium]|nr:phosphatase PAP2 family protein [Chitinophagaceae bacterium]HMX76554.1 phosphatase PAP2 family protein [Chitinophagaceae bacterium]HNA18319.1 phosphatase PAP2 family protein [Chitinophagaceae bacterium]HNA91091.1 phosphatase PAP2 family protein [Chitinophagaceae bacterium]HNA97657.1 phosphatase PAP2 family protein [Chitinophagaceae bacterium]
MKSTNPIGNTQFFVRFFIASLFVFVIIYLMVFVVRYKWIDDWVLASLNQTANNTITQFMRFITFYGNHSFLVPANLLMIVVLLYYKQKKWATANTIAALAGVGLMSMLKKILARPRPSHPLVEGISNFSFPSGHAMMSLMFYGMLILLCLQFLNNKAYKTVAIFLLVTIILLIGFSRLWLRVHFITDVLAGYAIGLCWLSISMLLSEKIWSRK